ncbi:uncharacterized protein LOC107369191 [Tetranychus urticae]|uniref:Uncharacterized protein n=1 Tax=Tetranychus urticae TaxID=32264 RepID=T1L0R6_TETUR|nr:uncharacterized protein LOC107369191 [Tetranychus urticae]
MESLRFLVTIITFSLLHLLLISSAPLDEEKLLRQIATQYSASMAVSFLHSRIESNERLVEKIVSELGKNLDQSKRDSYTLIEKSFEALDKQLMGLQHAGYFELDGTEKVEYFIEQFTMLSQLYPIKVKSSEFDKFNSTPDDLLEFFSVKGTDQVIIETQQLIDVFIKVMEEKESSSENNELQKLVATVTKSKLQFLANFKYSERKQNHFGHDTYPYFMYNNASDYFSSGIDHRTLEVEKVLRQLKMVLDLFYAQFEYLRN